MSGPAAWPAGRQAAVLGLLAALLYLPTLGHGFVNWDDDRVLLDNPAVARADGLAEIWSRAELPAGFPNYPLTFSSYWLEHRLWGFAPAGYHAVNALLHGLAAALVLLLLRAIGAGAWPALVGAALFAVHPVQVESVAWVAERKNVLSAVLYLLAFLAFLRHRDGGGERAYTLALLACAAALLAKTATVTLPLSLLLADRVRRGRWEASALLRVLPMFAFAAAAAGLTLLAETEPPPIAWAERPLLAATALWFYAGQLLAPAALLPIHPRWAVDPAALHWWLPLLGCVAVAALAWRLRPLTPAHWGLGHFAVTLLPVLGLVPYGFTELSFVAERHLYLASIGGLLLVALGLDWLRRRRAGLASLCAVLLVLLLAARTVRQVGVWRDGESLWRHQLAAAPEHWLALNNLAMALIAQERLDEAAPLLEQALAVRPHYAEAHNNLALVRYRSADYEAAERHSRAAVGLKPYETSFRKNLALTLVAQRRYDEAEAELRAALQTEPESLDLNLLLGRVLLAARRPADAVPPLAAVAAARPESAEAHYNLGLALLGAGRSDEARDAFDAALALQPDFPEARGFRNRLGE